MPLPYHVQAGVHELVGATLASSRAVMILEKAGAARAVRTARNLIDMLD